MNPDRIKTLHSSEKQTEKPKIGMTAMRAKAIINRTRNMNLAEATML